MMRKLKYRIIAFMMAMVLLFGNSIEVVYASGIESEVENQIESQSPEEVVSEKQNNSIENSENTNNTVSSEQEDDSVVSNTEEGSNENSQSSNSDNNLVPEENPEKKDAMTKYARIDQSQNCVYVGVVHGQSAEQITDYGHSPEYPYTDFTTAYENVPDGGTIYVVDRVDANPDSGTFTDWPAVSKNVTIAGYTEPVLGTSYTPTIVMSRDWVLSGDVVFRDICIKNSENVKRYLYMQGHKLQLGSGEAAEGAVADSAGIIPKKKDVYVESYDGSRTSYWLFISANPASGVSDSSITEMDVKLYNCGYVYLASGASTGLLTPELKTINIEIIGGGTDDILNFTTYDGWYASFAPAFDKDKLKTVSMKIAYAQSSSTIVLFRQVTETNSARGNDKNRGNYSADIVFDHMTASGIVNWGTMYTNGDVNIDVYDSSFTGHLIPAGGQHGAYGNITYNLYNSTLANMKRQDTTNFSHDSAGWSHTLTAKRYESITYNLYDGSKVNSTIEIADDATINLYPGATMTATSFKYFPCNLADAPEKDKTLKINIKKDANVFLPKTSYVYSGCIDINIEDNAALTLPENFEGIRNITNKGSLSVNGSQRWFGSYVGRSGSNVSLKGGSSIQVLGTVEGSSTATVTGESNQITSVSAALDSEQTLENTLTWTFIDSSVYSSIQSKGYWAVYKTSLDYTNTGCVYLRQGGNDNLSGESYVQAVASVERAYRLATKESIPKKIVICDEYSYRTLNGNIWEFGSGLQENEKIDQPVTVTTYDGTNNFYELFGASLICPDYSNHAYNYGLKLFAPFQFENMKFKGNNSLSGNATCYFSIYGNGYKTIMGTGVNSSNRIALFGGSNKDTCASTDLTVKDGDYYIVCGGSSTNAPLLTSISLNVTGCRLLSSTTSYPGIIVGSMSSIATKTNPATIHIDVNAQNSNDITGISYLVGGIYKTVDDSGAVYGNIILDIDGVSVSNLIGVNRGYIKSTIPSSSVTINIGKRKHADITNLISTQAAVSVSNTNQDGFQMPDSVCVNICDAFVTNLYGGTSNKDLSQEQRTKVTVNVLESSAYEVANDNGVKVLKDIGSFNISRPFVYSGSSILADTMKMNSGAELRITSSSTTLAGRYVVADGATPDLKLAPSGRFEITGKVSGTTNVSTIIAGKAFYISAETDPDNSTYENSFQALNITCDKGESITEWYYDPFQNSNLEYVYVDGTNGDDTYNGRAAAVGETIEDTESGTSITVGPVKTLAHAYDIVKNGGVIVVSGDTTISTWPATRKKILLTSDENLINNFSSEEKKNYQSEASLKLEMTESNPYVVLQEDLNIQHLNITYQFQSLFGGIDANGNALSIGTKGETDYSGVKFTKAGTSSIDNSFIITGGGTSNSKIGKVDLRIYNVRLGNVIAIYGSPYSESATQVNGDVNVSILDSIYKGALYMTACYNETLGINPDYQNLIYSKVDGNVTVDSKGVRTGSANQVLSWTGTTINGTTTVNYARTYDQTNTTHNSSYDYRFKSPHSKGDTTINYDGVFSFSYVEFLNYNHSLEDPDEERTVTYNFFGTVKTGILSPGGIQCNKTYEGKVNLVVNFGSADRPCVILSNGSTGQRSLVPQTGSTTNYKSIEFNIYSNDCVIVLNGAPKLTSSGVPKVVYHGISDQENTIYNIDDSEIVKNFDIVCDGAKVVQTSLADGTGTGVDLKNGGIYEYTADDNISLDRNLYIRDASSLFVNHGAISIAGDLGLYNGAKLQVNNLLKVQGSLYGDATDTLHTGIVLNPGSYVESTSLKDDSHLYVDYAGTSESYATDMKGIKVVVKEPSKPENSFRNGTIAGTDSASISLTYASSSTSSEWTAGSYGGAGQEIYLDEKGDDENDGTTPGTAVKTLKTALAIAENRFSETNNAQKIIISGNYLFTNDDTVDETFDLSTQVTISQKSGSGSRYYGKVTINDQYKIPDDIKFEEIKMRVLAANSQQPPEIFAQGNHLTIGKDVVISSSGSYLPILYGGTESDDISQDISIEVYSGNWSRIYGGGKNSNVTGNVNLVLGETDPETGYEGPVISTDTEDNDFSPELRATRAVFGGGYAGNVNGNTNITINSGESYNYIFGACQSGTVSGDTNIVFKSGSVHRLYGGSYTGEVKGKASIDFERGTANRIYGAGIQESATTNATSVTIGTGSGANKTAIVKNYLRGSGSTGGVEGEAVLTIKDGAWLMSNCSAAAGGYAGGVGRSILKIEGGFIETDICAGGYGAYIIQNGVETDIINKEVGYVSKSRLEVSGGTVKGNIFAGGNKGYVGFGSFSDEVLTEVVVTGTPDITGDIYGGCNVAETKGNITMSLASGTIKGRIFGGGCGRSIAQGDTADVEAAVKGKSTVEISGVNVTNSIYGGCNANGTVASTEINVTKLPGCNIFGAGYGENTSVRSTTLNLNLAGGQTEENTSICNVYGGGEQGKVSDTTTINAKKWIGNIFGGGKGFAEDANVFTLAKNALRTVGNAAVSLFSSGAAPFAIDGLVDANVADSTTVNVTGAVNGNIYGGGELATVGKEDNDKDTVVTHVNIEADADVTGNVYGGGQGREGKNYAIIYGATEVNINGGSIVSGDHAEDADTGCVFGGGQIAPVAGNTSVTAKGGTISNIFGGNDVSGEIGGSLNVVLPIDSQAIAAQVYGGGRNAAYTATDEQTDKKANVTISGGTVENVYGGGYGPEAQTTNTNVLVNGGTVATQAGREESSGRVFGGGNAAPTENALVTITSGNVSTIFGGGNAATVTGSTEVVVKTGEQKCVDTVFAGNNAAAMDIQPTLTFESGKIDTVYCGGNAGVMTGNAIEGKKLTYEFDYPNIEIGNVYAGCNNTPADTDTANVTLKLVSGKYGTIYGGNNKNGQMEATDVDISRGESNTLFIGTVYGGGNHAASKNTNVTLSSYSDDEELVIYGGGNEATSKNSSVELTAGKAKTIYGGGNAATVTERVSITAPAVTGGATVTDLYCGNNAADMSIKPTVDLDAVSITNFYGGGNKGKMTAPALEYTLDNVDTKITTAYGGCNQADVTGKVTLNLAGAKVDTAYGGCNTSGTMAESVVNVTGGAGTVFGGGNGRNTVVTTSNVNVNNGTVTGNIYGGSGEGYVETANVNIEEKQEDAQIVVEGNVFGAGYGVTSVAKNTNVKVSLGLDIGTDQNTQPEADLWVTEGKSSMQEDISGATKAEYTWNSGRENAVSVIEKSVFGGGDMGKVGNGDINISKNTAAISEAGSTNVLITGGYIQGNVFGGGNGTPPGGTSYTVYMGTVFGSSKVDVNGGLVEGSIYGCGNQSRTYADNQKAAVVDITEENHPIIIGTSVFGGGNKGEGKNVNASVETVLGDTEVNLTGKADNNPTRIYFISRNKGGVYGDGNLCLVKGTRTVNLKDFNYGNEYSTLKTFYSLQRADIVNMENSRVVLEGAEDLVDASASTELYSINRVGQLNMKKNSAVKLTTIVNLLGGLSSDQNTETTYINKGNNGINNYTYRGGTNPEGALTAEQISAYQAAYETFVKGGTLNSTYQSFNVVCVANGKYLEVKQSDSQYGNVTGLFTLQLLNANPGEGGGFVYANIGDRDAAEGLAKGSTGDFICVTRNGEDANADYMRVVDNVGGHEGTDYTYYYWYIKGGKYSYNVDLKGYIGVSDNDFTEKVSLPVQEGETNKQWIYVLNSVEGTNPVSVENANNAFHMNRLKTDWKEEYNTQDAYAVELKVITYGSTGTISEEKSLGYLAYDDANQKWYLNANDKYSYENGSWTMASAENNKVTGTGNSDEGDKQTIIDNTLFYYNDNPAQIELQAVLHKGSKVTVEMKDVFNKLVIDLRDGSDLNAVSGKDSQYVINTYTSITRIVPSQDVYMSSGRQYSGVSANSTVKIAQNSAFTVQYVTRYVPNAYPEITEKLTMNITEKYLWSDALGVGFTVKESEGNFILVSVTSGSKNDYTDKLSQDGNGNYLVNYSVSVTDENGNTTTETKTDTLKCQETKQYQSEFPQGTMITLVSKIDDCERTYWYYYCKNDMSEIELNDFVLMNNSFDSPTKKYTFENASNGSVKSSYSNRIVENLTFVIDFAKVNIDELSDDIKGMIQMKHMYDGAENRDIMDYVTPSEAEPAIYERSYPKITDEFIVSKTENGIQTFEMTLDKNKYYSKDRIEASVKIIPHPEYANTKFDEREYSVELKLKDSTGTVIPFPEGTVFTFEGRRLEASANNMSLIVPVKTTGEFSVNIETNIKGFEVGNYMLDAELYSSNVSDYHNSINAQKLEDGKVPTFAVISNPNYAISVKETGTNKIFSPGETIKLTVLKQISNGTDTNPVAVKLYSYDKSSKSYQLISMNELFESEEMTSEGIWEGKIKSDAQNNTYRLEFVYGDKTEYEDFIVKNSQN